MQTKNNKDYFSIGTIIYKVSPNEPGCGYCNKGFIILENREDDSKSVFPCPSCIIKGDCTSVVIECYKIIDVVTIHSLLTGLDSVSYKISTEYNSHVLEISHECISAYVDSSIVFVNFETNYYYNFENLFEYINNSDVFTVYGFKYLDGREEYGTTRMYWDCDCDEHYIHSRFDRVCINCEKDSKDCPDSHLSEIGLFRTMSKY